jgi:glycosyltransferase involved in cell wall biosynthesis
MTAADADPAFAPLVSVIIPAYNRAHLIGRAIASVLAQGYRSFEIIVVDDASTDKLAATLAEIDSAQLRCITHPRNRGAAAARNTGIAAANGEFVAFLDSDDIWFPDKLAQQVAAMRDQPPDVAGHVCAYDCLKAGDSPRVIAPGWTPLTFRRHQLFGSCVSRGKATGCWLRQPRWRELRSAQAHPAVTYFQLCSASASTMSQSLPAKAPYRGGFSTRRCIWKPPPLRSATRPIPARSARCCDPSCAIRCAGASFTGACCSVPHGG